MTPRPSPAASPAAVWGALAVVYVVWGSTYLAIRVLVDAHLPPLVSMGVRFLLAGALLGALVAWRRGWSALRVDRRGLAAVALVGTLLLGGGNGAVAVAEKTVPSGLAALLVAAVPLWVVAMRTATGDRPRWVSILGTLVGFAGIAVLARPGSVDEPVQTWGIVLILGGTICWATGSFTSSRLPLPRDPFAAAVYEMLLGGVVLLAAGTAAGEWTTFDPAAVETSGWLAFAYLVTFGSLAAFSAYVWLLGNAPISLTATYAFVNPAVAVVLGKLILDESVTTAVVVGGAVVVVGVALVVASERPRRETARPETTPVVDSGRGRMRQEPCPEPDLAPSA